MTPRLQLLLVALLAFASSAFAQQTRYEDDVYLTPKKARELRALRAQEERRMQERLAAQRAQQKAEQEQYQKQLSDWYNRRDMQVTISEMEQNLDELQDVTPRTAKGGEYARRLRRFHSDDQIVLEGVDRVYILDDLDYDSWSDSYYGYDNYNGVSIIINNNRWGSPYYYNHWGRPYHHSFYPWYDRWYGHYYGGWYGSPWGYDPFYYNHWYAPYYHRPFGWYGGGYHDYNHGYYHGYYDGYYGGYYGGNYGYVRPSAKYNKSGRGIGNVTRQGTQTYGRALGRSDRYESGSYRSSGRNNGYDRNASSNRSYGTSRSSETYNRNSGSATTRSSGSYSTGSSNRSNSGSSNTGSGTGAPRRSR